jgi:carbon storage regulator
MLVMRRRAGESFMIGEHIEIEVLELTTTRVKLGIVAPESVIILRLETQMTREENLSAASTAKHETIATLLGQLKRP